MKVLHHAPQLKPTGPDNNDNNGVHAPGHLGLSAPLNPMLFPGLNQIYPGIYVPHAQFNSQMPHNPYLPPFPTFPGHSTFQYPPWTASISSSPGSTTSNKVMVAEFCAKYHISQSDQNKLLLLEYHPGNHAVKHLEEQEWREISGFMRLGWEAFLVAHRKFFKAMKMNTWA